MSDSLRPHGLQHARLPCPSSNPGIFKLMSIKLAMSSNRFLLCCPLLLLPSIFPSISGFFQGVSSLHQVAKVLQLQLQLSPSSEYSGLISFRIYKLDILAVLGTLKSLLQHYRSEASILWLSAFFLIHVLHPYMTTRKNYSFDQMDLCRQSNVSTF